MADDDDQLQIGVTPIGQKDQPPPQPAQSPAPRAELVNTPKPDDSGSGDSGKSGPGATQADLAQHAYDLARRAEEDQNKARETYKGMQDEIRGLYRQEQQDSQEAMPQMEGYPEAPNTERKSLALAHMFMAIPNALFGGNKYNAGGALHGLNDVITEFKNAGTKKQIAQRIALYREQVNIVHQQNEDRLKQYQDIMANRKGDIHTKLETIKTLADVYKDTQTADAAATDNWEHFSEYLGKVQKMNEDTIKNVYGTMDEFNKAFGNSNEDQLYRSWGAENYSDLREGLFSDDPKTKGNAVRALEKRKSYYTWQKENWKWLHPSETAGEKEEELGGTKPPPDNPPDDMRKSIQELHPELFGIPKPGEEHKEKPKPPKYDPRKNWLANDPANRE